MATQYKAHFQGGDTAACTRFYDHAEQAQDALMRYPYVGHFHYLGVVAGDAFEHGRCEAAPRNGGLVWITTREVK